MSSSSLNTQRARNQRAPRKMQAPCRSFIHDHPFHPRLHHGGTSSLPSISIAPSNSATASLRSTTAFLLNKSIAISPVFGNTCKSRPFSNLFFFFCFCPFFHVCMCVCMRLSVCVCIRLCCRAHIHLHRYCLFFVPMT